MLLSSPKNLEIKIYKTIILPVVLYGCETWSLTLSKEQRLRVFDNRILRQIFWFKNDENAESRRLYKEELNSLYPSPNISRVIKSIRLRWANYVASMELGRSVFINKRPLGRSSRRWGDNIRMDLKERKQMSVRGTGLFRLGIGIIGNPCECGIEPPGFLVQSGTLRSNEGKWTRTMIMEEAIIKANFPSMMNRLRQNILIFLESITLVTGKKKSFFTDFALSIIQRTV